ncbi:MAG: flagellar motor protein MotD [Candidatus Accumulibacter sp.]|jgi:chemotaxis protein MotB|nr:flagellar motor protein MotD [Accumulibacter sp.]
MARRRKHEEHENHERWMVSYADFITLLFAFFVVMYSLSSINEGKYRVLSESMMLAFNNIQLDNSQILSPVEVAPTAPSAPRATQTPRITPAARQAAAARQKRRDQMRNVARDVLGVMAQMVEEGKVRIIETSRGVTIEINDSILFAPGQAVLNPLSSRAMRAIAEVLAPTDFPITIEGHTDDTPINTLLFPSNWELSAVRATTVLRLFVDAGVAPWRLTAIGYADTRPVESNDDAEGRARNRRVTILIDSSEAEQAQEIDIESGDQESGGGDQGSGIGDQESESRP